MENPTQEQPEIIEEKPSANSGSVDAALAILISLGYMLFYYITPLIRISTMPVVIATTIISIPLVLLVTVLIARAQRTNLAVAINLGLSVIFSLPQILLISFPRWQGWLTYEAVLFPYMNFLHYMPGLRGLLLIWFAASIGAFLSRIVREMKILLPMAVALALVDMYAVFGPGIVNQAVTHQSETASRMMTALTVSLPKTATATGAQPIQLQIGFADFLFIGLFFACFQRFGVRSRLTFSILCLVLTLYMAVVYIFGIPLPALIPIAAVVIGMNLKCFRYSRSEAFALLYAGLIVAVILGAAVLLGRH